MFFSHSVFIYGKEQQTCYQECTWHRYILNKWPKNIITKIVDQPNLLIIACKLFYDDD